MKAVIYHNPRCTKSRITLQILQENNIHLKIVEYLKTPPSIVELAEIVKLLSIKPRELLRKGEAAYKENNLDNLSLSDSEIIGIMHNNPILIERPIVIINNEEAVIGRPPEKVLDIISL